MEDNSMVEGGKKGQDITSLLKPKLSERGGCVEGVV